MRAHVPVRKVRGSRRDGLLMFISPLAGMVTVGSRPKPGEICEETGRAQLCAYVKCSTLNSAIEQELHDRRVEGRANATSSAWRGSVLVNPSTQKAWTNL